jgi:nucleotide-binding universal stress UspA family protein
MYKRILLPLDGSALAEQTLPYAVFQAERFQAELILLKVQEPLARNLNLPAWAVRKAEETTRKLAREYLERVAAGVRESGISVRVAMVGGHPHEEITRFAEAKQVDLIVICTRGYSGICCWLKGGVADRVARGVSVPVLLVRARKE